MSQLVWTRARRACLGCAVAASLSWGVFAAAQSPSLPRFPQASPIPVAPGPTTGPSIVPQAFNEAAATTPAAQHPLMPAVTRARQSLEQIAHIQDYSATLVKRERIDGELLEHEYMFVKVRHQPFSVYLYFLAPAKFKGQECLWVEGKNNGNLMAHPNGLKARLIGTVSLRPDSMIAMQGNRYPVTQLGIKRLTERLIEVGQNDLRFGECQVKTLAGAKINNRDSTCYEVVHPTPRKEFLYHIARIFVDTELNIPVRFEAYDWPTQPGGEPPLIEEYTYLNVKLNNGFTDADFDPANPKYQFK